MRPAFARPPITLLLACCAFASRADTQWTNAAGNNLWADPLNWTNGVPTADAFATITRYDPTPSGIDLGGDTRQVDYLYLRNELTRIANGTLAVNHIEYDGIGRPETATIAASLTTTSGHLELNSINSLTRLRIEGPIVGDAFDVHLAHTALAGVNAYTGRTLLSAPFEDAALVDQGALPSTAAVEIGYRLILDNGKINVADRLNDRAPIRLTGGDLQVRGNPDAAASERVGVIQFSDGGGTLSLLPVGRLGQKTFPTVALHAAAMQRAGDGVATLLHDHAAGDRTFVDVPPAMIGDPAGPPTARPIVPWMITAASVDARWDLVTYDSTSGFRPLDPNTEIATDLPPTPDASAPNVRLLTPSFSSRDVGVNSFSGNLTLAAGARLNVNSGVLIGATLQGTGSVRAPGELIAYGTTIAVPLHAQALTLVGINTLSAPLDVAQGIVVASSAGERFDLHLTDGADLGNAPVRFLSTGFLTIESARTIPNDLTLGQPVYALSESRWILNGQSDYIRITLPARETVALTGSLRGHTAAVHLRGDRSILRIDGNGTFHSLYIGADGNTTLELNGTLRPDDDRDDLATRFYRDAIQVSGNLAGDGTLLGFLNGGTVSPGRPGLPGRITIDSLSGASLTLDIDGPEPGTGYDQLVVLTAVFNGLSRLQVDLGFAPDPGQTFTVVDNRSPYPIDSRFWGLPQGALLQSNNTLFQISYTAGDGNDIALTVVPEPTTAPLIACGVASLLHRGRRRRHPQIPNSQ